jgi:hypothetical protein
MLELIIVFVVLLPIVTVLTGWMHGFPVLQWMGLRKPPPPPAPDSDIKKAVRSMSVAVQKDVGP